MIGINSKTFELSGISSLFSVTCNYLTSSLLNNMANVCNTTVFLFVEVKVLIIITVQ